MQRTIGVNTWVWTSPLTDDSLAELAPKIARMGFGAIELPLENAGDWDAGRAGDLLDSLRLQPVVIGAMGPGRSLVDRAGNVAATQAYLRTCLAAARRVGASVVAGPFYAPTGVTWRMTGDERTEVVAQLRRNLEPLVDEAAAGRPRARRRTVEPLRDERDQHRRAGARRARAAARRRGSDWRSTPTTSTSRRSARTPPSGRPPGASRTSRCAEATAEPVGDDHTDWPATLAALDEAGYEGILGLESFTGENATIAVAASVWRPLASSQDDLAERSLRYLTALQAQH